MKKQLTQQQKAAYKEYLAECRFRGATFIDHLADEEAGVIFYDFSKAEKAKLKAQGVAV